MHIYDVTRMLCMCHAATSVCVLNAANSVCVLKLHREGDEEPEEELKKKKLHLLETTYIHITRVVTERVSDSDPGARVREEARHGPRPPRSLRQYGGRDYGRHFLWLRFLDGYNSPPPHTHAATANPPPPPPHAHPYTLSSRVTLFALITRWRCWCCLYCVVCVVLSY
jgi:hypothetical protein